MSNLQSAACAVTGVLFFVAGAAATDPCVRQVGGYTCSDGCGTSCPPVWADAMGQPGFVVSSAGYKCVPCVDFEDTQIGPCTSNMPGYIYSCEYSAGVCCFHSVNDIGEVNGILPCRLTPAGNPTQQCNIPEQ